MLFNPQWGQPVNTKPLEPWRQALLDAAQYIRDHGWCQGEAMDGDGRVCLNGAVLYSDKQFTEDDLVGFRRPSSIAIEAYSQLTKSLTKHDPRVDKWGPSSWNDKSGRTVDEVIAALEGAARS